MSSREGCGELAGFLLQKSLPPWQESFPSLHLKHYVVLMAQVDVCLKKRLARSSKWLQGIHNARGLLCRKERWGSPGSPAKLLQCFITGSQAVSPLTQSNHSQVNLKNTWEPQNKCEIMLFPGSLRIWMERHVTRKNERTLF